MIDLDVTILIQFVNFVITLVVLNFILVRPIREIIKKRANAMSGLLDGAEQFTTQAEDKIQNYEKALGEARAKGAEQRAMYKDEGAAEESKIVAAATEEAQAQLAEQRQAIQAEAKSAKDGLSGQVAAMATKVADKVLA